MESEAIVRRISHCQIIDTRWSGHKKAVDSVLKNYEMITKTLNDVKNDTAKKFDGEDKAIATGILQSMQKFDFVFMLKFLNQLFNIIEPAN